MCSQLLTASGDLYSDGRVGVELRSCGDGMVGLLRLAALADELGQRHIITAVREAS